MVMCLFLLSACSLPRGAALQSEVTAAAGSADAPFAVYQVSRDTVGDFKSWPHWYGYVGWLGTTRGPSSPIIRAGDVLDLVIWDNSDNSLLLTPGAKTTPIQGLTVSADGSVFIPYLDKVYVSGRSPEKAREDIQYRMSAILPSAQVQLNYRAGASSSVSLVGGVGAPGTYPLPDRNFSVLNLISQGGGVPPNMRNPQVTLIRQDKTFRTSLSLLYDDASFDVVLRGGDKLIVEQDQRYFQSLGSSGREEIVYFTKESINALEAVSMIGGINDQRADPQGVMILRQYPAEKLRDDGKGPSRQEVVFNIDLTSADGLFAAKNFYIEPEDVVLVAESPFTMTQSIFNLVGSLFGVAGTVRSFNN